VTFIAGWFLGGLAQPGAYSVILDDISDLGALTADKPWLYNQLGVNLTGLLVLALSVGLWKTVGTGFSARLGVIALGVAGLGTFLDGLLREDCRKIDAACTNRFASWHGPGHAIETVFTVLGTFVAVFALARAFKVSDRWNDLWLPTLVAGIATLAAIVVLSIPGAGLGVRVGTAIWFLWVALVSYRLLRIAGEPQEAQLPEV
jgi:hypothetical membrane protein